MRTRKAALAVMLILWTVGCDTENERVAQIAEESAARQAQQHQEMIQLHREVAEGTRRLVEADSQARQDMIAAQQDLSRQQAEIARQRDELETERRSIAQKQSRDSLLVPLISHTMLLVACSLPVLLAWYLLRGWQEGVRGDEDLGRLLLEEFTSDRPWLLPQPFLAPPRDRGQPGRPRIGHDGQSENGVDASG